MARQATTNQDIFALALRDAYDVYTLLKRKVDAKGITVSNWTTQSVANRTSSESVKATMKLAKKTIKVELTNWCPARMGAGYDNEAVGLQKSQASVSWNKAHNMQWAKSDRECLSWIAYFLDGLLTGSGMSGESAGKVLFISTILDRINPDSLDVTILVKADQASPITFTLENIKALVAGYWPRVQAILDLPERESEGNGKIVSQEVLGY